MMNEPARILVGPHAVPFYVPEDALAEKLPRFFGQAFKGGWLETERKVLELPEENVDGFRLFLEWVCRGTLAPIPECPGLVHGGDYQNAVACEVAEHLAPWFEAVVIADKWAINELFELLLDKINFFHDENAILCHPALIGLLVPMVRPGNRIEKFLEGHFDEIRHRKQSDLDFWFAIVWRVCPEYTLAQGRRHRDEKEAEETAEARRREDRRLRHNRSSNLSHWRRRQRLKAARQG